MPVIRDVDRKGITEPSQELGAVSQRMREGKIAPADIQGGTFSISSLGGIGGTSFTPIVNAPEVAILGLVRAEMKPKRDGANFVPRLMLPLSVSYDHRVIDGALAARFDAPSGRHSRRRAPARALKRRESDVAETEAITCDVAVLGVWPRRLFGGVSRCDLGLNTVLIERDATLGGVCLNVGCIPSKALLHVASLIYGGRALRAHGVEFGMPRFDLGKLRAHKDAGGRKLTGGLAAMAKMRKVTVVQGTGTFSRSAPARRGAEQGARLPFASRRRSSPRGPRQSRRRSCPRIPASSTRRARSPCASIPKRMLVIGGGIIGLEMATVYAALGSKIDVAEMLDGLMAGADRDLVRVWQKYECVALQPDHAEDEDGRRQCEARWHPCALRGLGCTGGCRDSMTWCWWQSGVSQTVR